MAMKDGENTSCSSLKGRLCTDNADSHTQMRSHTVGESESVEQGAVAEAAEHDAAALQP
jgi:hypothetical protein